MAVGRSAVAPRLCEHTLDVAGYTVRAYSVAGVATTVVVRSQGHDRLHVAFDMG
jgi:hypothetical protein